MPEIPRETTDITPYETGFLKNARNNIPRLKAEEALLTNYIGDGKKREVAQPMIHSEAIKNEFSLKREVIRRLLEKKDSIH